MTVFFISADAGEVDKESTKLDLAGMMTSQEVEGTSSKDQLKPSSSKTGLKKTGKLPEFVLHRTPPPYTNVTDMFILTLSFIMTPLDAYTDLHLEAFGHHYDSVAFLLS